MIKTESAMTNTSVYIVHIIFCVLYGRWPIVIYVCLTYIHIRDLNVDLGLTSHHVGEVQMTGHHGNVLH